jgi:YidC/Oxa1 family membrane protein insertase
MIDLFVQLILNLNKLLFDNLGLTIIVIGILSRAIFYPFYANSIRYSKAMRDLKPKLDEIKRKYKGDMQKLASEQSKIFKEAGVSPAAGAIGCISIIIQIAIFFLLFQSLRAVVDTGVDTNFLIWDLAKPDAYKVQGIPLPLPGLLVILTAFFSLIQSRMLAAPPSPKQPAKKADKPDISDALAATQGQMLYIIPVIILVSGPRFASALALYWFVSTAFGIIQQYNIAGVGGLEPWLKKLKLVK